VLQAGELAGTFCDGLGTFVQVEPVDTVVGRPDNIPVFLSGQPDFSFTLRRLP
jgi:hypothetical protein